MTTRHLADQLLRSGTRVGVYPDQTGIWLIYETRDAFNKARLTHDEARRLAFMLLGSSDPYTEAKEG